MTFENGDTGLCSVCAITLNSGNGENKIIDNERTKFFIILGY